MGPMTKCAGRWLRIFLTNNKAKTSNLNLQHQLYDSNTKRSDFFLEKDLKNVRISGFPKKLVQNSDNTFPMSSVHPSTTCKRTSQLRYTWTHEHMSLFKININRVRMLEHRKTQKKQNLGKNNRNLSKARKADAVGPCTAELEGEAANPTGRRGNRHLRVNTNAREPQKSNRGIER